MLHTEIHETTRANSGGIGTSVLSRSAKTGGISTERAVEYLHFPVLEFSKLALPCSCLTFFKELLFGKFTPKYMKLPVLILACANSGRIGTFVLPRSAKTSGISTGANSGGIGSALQLLSFFF